MKRLFQHAVITVFITCTLAGFTYAVCRYPLPGVPRFLWMWSYGMMAPYQTYRTINEELVAWGDNGDGDWQKIDLQPYLPYIRGERAYRSYLVSFRAQGDDVWPKKYEEYAQKVQSLEWSNDHKWIRVRLELEKWPKSPAGYEYLRAAPFITRTPLAEISL